MSRTLADAERTVRYHLRDRNPQGQAFTSPEVVHEIESAARLLAPKLLPGDEHVTALVTTAALTQFYPLPGTQTYRDLIFLKYQDDGSVVEIVPPARFEATQSGEPTSNPTRGRPQIAMLRESTNQSLEIGFWPAPDAVYVLDGYRTLLPAGFFLAGSGALNQSPDATVIPFDDQGFEALCYEAASELYARMPDADKERLKIAEGAANGWPRKAAALVAASRRRRIFQKVGGSPRGRRW